MDQIRSLVKQLIIRDFIYGFLDKEDFNSGGLKDIEKNLLVKKDSDINDIFVPIEYNIKYFINQNINVDAIYNSSKILELREKFTEIGIPYFCINDAYLNIKYNHTFYDNKNYLDYYDVYGIGIMIMYLLCKETYKDEKLIKIMLQTLNPDPLKRINIYKLNCLLDDYSKHGSRSD